MYNLDSNIYLNIILYIKLIRYNNKLCIKSSNMILNTYTKNYVLESNQIISNLCSRLFFVLKMNNYKFIYLQSSLSRKKFNIIFIIIIIHLQIQMQ